jgi:hypothetical protein
MNYDFFMGQLRLIAVGILAYGSGKGWFSVADAGIITQIVTPVGLLVGPWIWSIYRNVGKKLVPQNSVAIEPHAITGGAVVGSTVALPSTAKVVG